jgi:hypothetical protein
MQCLSENCMTLFARALALVPAPGLLVHHTAGSLSGREHSVILTSHRCPLYNQQESITDNHIEGSSSERYSWVVDER